MINSDASDRVEEGRMNLPILRISSAAVVSSPVYGPVLHDTRAQGGGRAGDIFNFILFLFAIAVSITLSGPLSRVRAHRRGFGPISSRQEVSRRWTLRSLVGGLRGFLSGRGDGRLG